MCQTRMIRIELRKRKVYPVIKNLHADGGIENEDFENAVFEIVNFLDEEREAPKEDGDDQLLGVMPASANSTTIDSNSNSAQYK